MRCILLGVCLLEVFEELNKFVVWEAFAYTPNSFAERIKLFWRLGLSSAAAAAAVAAAAFRNGQWLVRSFDGVVRCSN